MEAITIDGSQGEGGGQILRTSISVAMLQARPIHLINIRAGRKKPGLMRQHLMSVRAAAEISDAEVKGDELGSQELFFHPKEIKNGRYNFSIGTAGSTTLVFQTILPALLQADGPSEILFEGGTHNGMSPSLTFIAKSFLPFLETLGVKYKIDINQFGFYPVGGGSWKLNIKPCKKLKAINLTDTPRWQNFKVEAVVSDKLPEKIGDREINAVKRYMDIKPVDEKLTIAPSLGPGNTLHISAESHGLTSMVEVTGEKDVRAEMVAKKTVTQFGKFRTSGSFVEEHLADQLLLYIVMAGKGAFTTVKPSLHTETNIAVLEMLTDKRFPVTKTRDSYKITVN